MSKLRLITSLLFTACSSSSNAESKDVEATAKKQPPSVASLSKHLDKAFSKEDASFSVGRHYGLYEGYLDRDRSSAMKALAMVQAKSMMLGIATPQHPGKRDEIFLGIERKNSTKIAQTFGLGYEVSRQWLQGKSSGKFPDVAYLEGLAKKLELPAPIVEKAAAATRAPSAEVLAELGALLDAHY